MMRSIALALFLSVTGCAPLLEVLDVLTEPREIDIDAQDRATKCAAGGYVWRGSKCWDK